MYIPKEFRHKNSDEQLAVTLEKSGEKILLHALDPAAKELGETMHN